MHPIDFGKGLVPAGIFVTKIDGRGNTICSVGGGGDPSGSISFINSGTSLAIDSKDDIVVAGACVKTINFGTGDLPSPTGGQDMFVAKLQAKDGKALWAKRSTGDGIETMGGVTLDSSGSIFVAGTSQHLKESASCGASVARMPMIYRGCGKAGYCASMR